MKRIQHSGRPLILVTNDDGIQAKGIQAVAEFLAPLGDIVMVAPDAPRSGQSAAITVDTPLRMSILEEREGFCRVCTNGTPVDCVKLALNILLDCRPHLIVSGINHGSNAGISEIYSGTMGAVFEGTVLGIPSIGFSLCDYSPAADFSVCREAVLSICQKALSQDGWPQGVGLNVNFPDVEQLQGVKVCRGAHGYWVREYDVRTDPHGNEYYWLTGHFHNTEPEADDTDEYWLQRGFATLVPCSAHRSVSCEIPFFSALADL